ncbi:MAG: putative transposase [Myxococcota bacterium]|jgi:putative transposase
MRTRPPATTARRAAPPPTAALAGGTATPPHQPTLSPRLAGSGRYLLHQRMARRPRIDFPGARHHVMNRATARQPIFTQDADCVQFLAVLADVPDRFGAIIHGYALMPNHFHLMVEVPEGNLSAVMRYLGATFTQAFNRRTGRDGPVFRGRYRNQVVRTDAYWAHLIAYLHLNPVRAHLAPRPEDCPWTSHAAYINPSARPDWLTCDDLLDHFGSRKALAEYVHGVHIGANPPPPVFDAERLWRAPATDDTPTKPRPDPTPVDQALADVAQVLGVPADRVLELKRGRTANLPAWIAAWWLSRAAGLSQREIGLRFGISRARASQLIASVQERAAENPQVKAWMTELDALRANRRKA